MAVIRMGDVSPYGYGLQRNPFIAPITSIGKKPSPPPITSIGKKPAVAIVATQAAPSYAMAAPRRSYAVAGSSSGAASHGVSAGASVVAPTYSPASPPYPAAPPAAAPASYAEPSGYAPEASAPIYPSSYAPGAPSGPSPGGVASAPGGSSDLTQAAPNGGGEASPVAGVSPTVLYVGGGALALLAGLSLYLAFR